MSEEESFFREVDEDYRREQIIKFFQRYGAYFAGAAFIILAVVAGYSIERWRRAEQAAQGGDALTNALLLAEAGKEDEARKALSSLAENGPSAYRFLARMHLAADSVAKKQPDAAKAMYRSVAEDASAPADLRDFAKLQLAALSVDGESFGTLSRELQSFRSGTSPWRFTATEILGLSALKEGNKAEAEKFFGELVSDGSAPQGMRQRAQIMLALLFEKPKADPAKPTGNKDAANDARTQ
jgi:hypothetical protein